MHKRKSTFDPPENSNLEIQSEQFSKSGSLAVSSGSEGVGSKFKECPICSQRMPFYKIADHVNQHFAVDEVTSSERDSTVHLVDLTTVDQSIVRHSPSRNCWRHIDKRDPRKADDEYEQETCVLSDKLPVENSVESVAQNEEAGSFHPLPTHDRNQGWSFLKAPSSKDIRGARRTRKAFDLPPQVSWPPQQQAGHG
jgi:hypothetical protein